MDAPNVLMGRIDNRLVHGQVGAVWTRQLGANLIIVADDEVANDEIQKSVMGMVANTIGVQIRFFSIQKTIDVIWKAAPSQKIFIITKTPKEMRALIEGNVPIKQVNVGNMHASDNRRPLSGYVFVNDDDIADLDAIKNRGVEVFLQLVPNHSKQPY